jgi:2'-5' RNA ligase
MTEDQNQKLRLFFAVDFEDELRAQAAQMSLMVRKDFESDPANGRRRWAWVAEKNFHLTVKFLGATEKECVPEILAAAQKALESVSAFEIEMGGAGAFPRVLWLDIRDRSSMLSRIAQSLNQALEPLGFAQETRSFVPHLTLARLKEGRPIRAEKDLKPELRQRRLGHCQIREVILYQSETRPTGAVYQAVGRIQLHS